MFYFHFLFQKWFILTSLFFKLGWNHHQQLAGFLLSFLFPFTFADFFLRFFSFTRCHKLQFSSECMWKGTGVADGHCHLQEIYGPSANYLGERVWSRDDVFSYWGAKEPQIPQNHRVAKVLFFLLLRLQKKRNRWWNWRCLFWREKYVSTKWYHWLWVSLSYVMFLWSPRMFFLQNPEREKSVWNVNEASPSQYWAKHPWVVHWSERITREVCVPNFWEIRVVINLPILGESNNANVWYCFEWFVHNSALFGVG